VLKTDSGLGSPVGLGVNLMGWVDKNGPMSMCETEYRNAEAVFLFCHGNEATD